MAPRCSGANVVPGSQGRLGPHVPERTRQMSRFTRLLVPAAVLCALVLGGTRPRLRRERPGRLGRLAVGQPAAAGQHVRGLAFSGGSGYAVGDFGTVLATDDAGATWRGLVSGTLQNLTEVQAIDKDSLFAGGGCVGRRSDDGGKTFTRVAFTPVETNCRQPLAAVWFATETDRLHRARRRHDDPHRQQRPELRLAHADPGLRRGGRRREADRHRLHGRRHGPRGDHGRQGLPHDRRREHVDARGRLRPHGAGLRARRRDA